MREEGLRLYIGIVGSQGIAGRRASHQSVRHSVSVDLAESAMAFFLELPLNVAKRCRPPRDGIVLVNRWWSADLESRVRRRPHPDWPDLIDYDDYSGDAIVRGKGRRATFLDAADIREIGARASRDIAARRARAARALTDQRRAAGRRGG